MQHSNAQPVEYHYSSDARHHHHVPSRDHHWSAPEASRSGTTNGSGLAREVAVRPASSGHPGGYSQVSVPGPHPSYYYSAPPPAGSAAAPSPAPQPGYPPVYHHSLGDYRAQVHHHHSVSESSPRPHYASEHGGPGQGNVSYLAASGPPPISSEWSQLPPIRLLPPLSRPPSLPYLSTAPSGYSEAYYPPLPPSSWSRSPSSAYAYAGPVDDPYNRHTPQYYERRPSPSSQPAAGAESSSSSRSYDHSQERQTSPGPASTSATTREMESEQFDERVKFEESVQALHSLASAASGSRNGAPRSNTYQNNRGGVGSNEARAYQGIGADPQRDGASGISFTSTSKSHRASNSTASTPVSNGPTTSSWHNGSRQHAERDRDDSESENGSADSGHADQLVVGPDGKLKKKRKRRRKATEEPRDFASRKFTCVTCKKMFARPSALATHERSHSKEKPHSCPVESCQRRFAVPSNLRRHQRVYKHYDPNAPLPPDASPGSRNPQAREASATSSQSHDLAASMLPPMLPPAASESSSTAGLLPLHRPSLPHRHSGDAPNWQSQ